MGRMVAWMGVLLALGVPVGVGADPLGSPLGVRRALHESSASLDGDRCSGVLAESSELVLTARHCVGQGGDRVRVRFPAGFARGAWVVAIDERADQAVLLLESAVPLEPLTIARRPVIPGAVLYFEGNPSRPRFQSARLDRIGRCQSLPTLPNALFTGIEGEPGDSGAPLVDGAMQVVGLVHGGARCHIATPADTLGRLIDRLLERETPQVAAAPYAEGADSPSRRIFADSAAGVSPSRRAAPRMVAISPRQCRMSAISTFLTMRSSGTLVRESRIGGPRDRAAIGNSPVDT
jgi:S1-C subfamily serine protease